jgi:hypothetical protein
MFDDVRSGIFRSALIAVLFAVTTACDAGQLKAPPDTETPLTSTVSVPAKAVTNQTRWNWGGGDLQGWVVEPVGTLLLWPASGGVAIISSQNPAAGDVFLRSPDLSFLGKDFTRVMVELEAVTPGSEVDSALYYSTPEHEESFDYRGGPLNGGVLTAGERRILVYDMINQAAGAPDWIDSTINQIRFDLPEGRGAHYIVHSITLCPAASEECE